MDFLTKKERSKRMSLIRSKWTKQERKMHNMLKGMKVKHKMHPNLVGNPDILIGGKKIIFLHGCFWHKCPKCYREPSSNKGYWLRKLERNARRDALNRSLLRSEGFNVVCVWEHEVNRSVDDCMKRVLGEK